MLFCGNYQQLERNRIADRRTHNELLNEDSLADTGTTEKTNLTTTGVRGEKVDNLDTSDKNLGRGGLVSELGGFGVDGGELDTLDGTTLVNGVTSDVHDATETAGTDGDLDGGTSVDDLAATDETLSTVHGNATDDVLTQMLLELVRQRRVAGGQCGEAYGDLENELLATVLGGNGVENGRELLAIELDCKRVSVGVFMRRLRDAAGDNGVAAAVALVLGVVGKRFSHTVDDGTNDLVDSAIGVGGRAGEALAQGGSERRLDGLEGALQSSRATGRSPQ